MRLVTCSLVFLGAAGFLRDVSARASASEKEPAPSAREQEPPAEKAGPPAKARPSFTNIRFDEDWSYLRDNPTNQAYESFKFIPLNSSGSAYLSLGGQLRLRSESWSDFGFGGPGDRDDFFGLSRLRLHGDLWLGSRFRFFVEGKSALATSRDLPGGLRTLDVDSIDLQNALVDVRASLEPISITLRVGRQEMQFGKQRLVSPLDWANTRRTFDAARAIVQGKTWRIDGFWSKFAPVKKYSFNSSTDSGVEFFGIFGTSKLGANRNSLDLYWLGFKQDGASLGGVRGEEDRQTFGGRLSGTLLRGGGADYDLEAALQIGDHASRDIRATMFAGQFGYRLARAAFNPRVYWGFDFASGDGDPGDGKVQTFNQLFPLGHAYLGYIDIVGRQNIMDLSQGLSATPAPKWTLSFDAHNFWRASRSDALYNAGGGVVRSGSAGNSRYVGFETDLTAAFTINRFLVLSGGYSHIFPGKFIEESGPSEGTDFLYIVLQTTF